MFDFIPVEYYSAIYYQIVLILTLLLTLVLFSSDITDSSVRVFSSQVGYPVFIFTIFYVGVRQVSSWFGDTVMYDKAYRIFANGGQIKIEKDYLFNYFMLFCSQIMNIRFFFLIISFFYVYPLYAFTKKFFGSYWFLGFFFLLAGFSFWPYGVNGIRNGMAASVFLWGLTYYKERKWLMYFLLAISLGIHSSMIIPIMAFIAALLIKSPKIFLWIWLLAIPLSIIGGGFWTNFFSSFGFGDERAEAYLGQDAISNLAKGEGTVFSSIGFRWDFVLYSTTGILSGYYFLIRKKVNDPFFLHLWGIYLIANAFWILVIRAAFSNRFAYLSWFLLGAVIIYPFLRYKFSNSQSRILAQIMIVYYAFTYYMYFK